jgi:hypothetical protein
VESIGYAVGRAVPVAGVPPVFATICLVRKTLILIAVPAVPDRRIFLRRMVLVAEPVMQATSVGVVPIAIATPTAW